MQAGAEGAAHWHIARLIFARIVGGEALDVEASVRKGTQSLCQVTAMQRYQHCDRSTPSQKVLQSNRAGKRATAVTIFVPLLPKCAHFCGVTVHALAFLSILKKCLFTAICATVGE
jgi:hypothetical protein